MHYVVDDWWMARVAPHLGDGVGVLLAADLREHHAVHPRAQLPLLQHRYHHVREQCVLCHVLRVWGGTRVDRSEVSGQSMSH